MNALDAGAATDPHSITDLLYAIYFDHVPPQNRARFLALLDSWRGSSASDPTPDAQWLAGALDSLDQLTDPFNQLSDVNKRVRNALRLAALELVWARDRDRLRAESKELPL